MINAILKGIFKLITSLVTVILLPIDTLISTALPTLDSWITAVGNFLSMATSSLGWVLSCVGISGSVLTMIVAYYTFKLSVPLLVYTIKLALKWYDKLKV